MLTFRLSRIMRFMDRTLPERMIDTEDFVAERAEKLKGILEFAWIDIPDIAGSGKTLDYLMALQPNKHPARTFIEDMGGGNEAFMALVVDLANHPAVAESAEYDLCQSIDYSLHIIYNQLGIGSPRSELERTCGYVSSNIWSTARKLVEEGKPIRDVFSLLEDTSDFDPYIRLMTGAN